jgi:Ca2+-binding RTX toxin-like protein
MTGDDLIYGNSDDDDIYGEAGQDFISGGTGRDGVLGDDGLIFTSRNKEIENGNNPELISEPLYGVERVEEVNKLISTPGNIQQEIINLDFELKKTVDLISFEANAVADLGVNDIIYGGLGDDFIHAGAGDDAVSGGEALPEYYTGGTLINLLLQAQQLSPSEPGTLPAENPFWFNFAPYNPGDILRFEGNGKTSEFALYDEFNPRRKIMLSENADVIESATGTPGSLVYSSITTLEKIFGGSLGPFDVDLQILTGPPRDTTVTDVNVTGAFADEEALRVGIQDAINAVLPGGVQVTVDGEFEIDLVNGHGQESVSVRLVVEDAHDFLLNFDPTEGPLDNRFEFSDEGPGIKATDGDDRIFGDLGNDWIVGGTGRDRMYGGRGDDLLNADDDHDTTLELVGDPGLKNNDPPIDALDNFLPDAFQAYADIFYAGSGRDVLILNTGVDRSIDWVGEFNSYIAPFAPFGAFHISRTLQPQLMDFLYDLSEGDGADQSTPDGARFVVDKHIDVRIDDPSALRNGEPYGELGLVLQQDIDWQEQTGGPIDPQAGNIPGGPREIMRRALFNVDGDMEAFAPDSGSWTVENSALRVTAESLGGDAVSVFHVDEVLPNYYEIFAKIATDKPTGGWKANAYVVFDYYGPEDFKFAGIDDSINKLVIGHRDASGWHVDKQNAVQGGVRYNKVYNMLIAVHGTTVTVVVGANSFSHVFDPRIVNGWSYGLNTGFVGFGSDNARGYFDDIVVQKLPPTITLEDTDDFTDGIANYFTGPQLGDWQVLTANYQGSPLLGDDLAVSMVDLGLENGFEAYSILEMESTFNTNSIGGMVFDYYGPEDFKFVAIDALADQILIGHHTSKGGLSVDALVDQVIDAGIDYNVGVSLKGSSVNVTIDNFIVLGHVFHSVIVDGPFGLMSWNGDSAFDEFTFRTDDPAFSSSESSALMATQSAAESTATSTLTHGELEKIFNAAVTRWIGVGYIDQARLATLDDLELTIADMAGLTLGRSSGNRITIDSDAAGYGWFVDETPEENEEFLLSRNGWVAKPNSAASGKMDLLTAVSHEIGHYLGLDHHDATSDSSVMSDSLESGTRYADEGTIRNMGEDTLLSSAFFAAGSAFMEEALGLTGESEDEEDGSDYIPVLIFDQESGTFSESESEESDDDDWYIDNGQPETDEDAYALFDLDDGSVTQLAGLSLDENKGKGKSSINWDGRFAN